VAGTRSGNADAEPLNMQMRVGSTLYLVNIHFSETAAETMDDKILRMIRNDLNCTPKDAKMALPQTDRLPERSSA